MLRGAGAAAAGLALGPRSLLARAAAGALASDRILVEAFLRGGADGLSLCAPYAEPEYYAARPTIALPRPRQAGGDSLLDLDGHFGLHPDLAPLLPLWEAGRFAVLQAAGCRGLSRSHFDAQEFVETGTPGVKGTPTGWLDRCLARGDRHTVTSAVAFSPLLPRSFLGPEPVLVSQDLARFDFEAPGWREEAERALRRLYERDKGPMGRTGIAALDAIAVLKRNPRLREEPANGAVYPEGFTGTAFRQAAGVVKAELGTRCIFIDVAGDFDTHANQLFQNRKDYRELAAALAAFDRDLGRAMDRVVVLVTTEFGRTLAEGSGGTDHGSGGVMLLLGGPVRGRRVHGSWAGLA
ncbi:MAG TPA: DUF1501 domain-containing protein, partial [Thermoanaerobaculia bacterium]|nr:DUF1501 domain-containing protein [Thermoanaerobaculia bacterium]